MILRVPDYYKTFRCTADACKDSCCIGWEIDIDEDTYEFYRQQQGAFGERLQTHMYETYEGEHSFRLGKGGRCPFLNDRNLCDICIELGEEALSEVCTEYPRFAIVYGDVLQKCLSLSCEEVGRILFSREEPVKIVDYHIGGEAAGDDASEDEAFEDELQWISFLERVQEYAIELLQERKSPLAQRICRFLTWMETVQNAVNESEKIPDLEKYIYKFENEAENNRKKKAEYSSEIFFARFDAFTEMETLDHEWEEVKGELGKTFSADEEDSYRNLLQQYLESPSYQERDYEQLLVYFFFRYFMNSVYDYEVLSYAKLAVVFTLVIRDMDVVRWKKNQGKYDLADRIDVVRIFSKEVEHSQENVELIREAFLFEEVYRVDSLIEQV